LGIAHDADVRSGCVDSLPADADARRPTLRNEFDVNHRTLPILVLLVFSSLSRADGGAVRLCERSGDYQLAVFTAPTPFRAGPVDISVLVQDAATGECTPEGRVTLRLTAHESGRVLEYEATSGAASNKLFYAAVFELPEAGWWDVDVFVDGPHGSAHSRLQIEAGKAPPRWLDLWPWFGLPALAVAFFSLHRVLVRRRRPPK
jgi:hypothetical protein